jgi:hypothetical protein
MKIDEVFDEPLILLFTNAVPDYTFPNHDGQQGVEFSIAEPFDQPLVTSHLSRSSRVLLTAAVRFSRANLAGGEIGLEGSIGNIERLLVWLEFWPE